MKRNNEFKQPSAKPTTISDSRFGIRKIYLNTKESPRIASYRKPGRGPNGEHQN